MKEIPSKFVSQRVQYGEGQKHFYPCGDAIYHPTKEKAEAEITKAIKDTPNHLYVLLKVEALFHASEIEVACIDAE